MKSTTEIRIYELLKKKFDDSTSQELVGEIKSLTNDDLLERMDDKIESARSNIISTLTWRLLFFFIVQVGFTVALLKLLA